MEMSMNNNLARLSGLLQSKRRERDISLRAAALEIGLSPSTLSRLERAAATSLPDAETLTKLAAWLEIPMSALLSEASDGAKQNYPQLSTPEHVSVHLRADKRLSPQTAQSLSRMFQLLYDEFVENEATKRSTGKATEGGKHD